MTLWEATRAVGGRRREEDEQQLEAGRRRKGRLRGVWMVIRGVLAGRRREFNLTCLSTQTMQTTWSKQRMLQKKQQKTQQKT